MVLRLAIRYSDVSRLGSGERNAEHRYMPLSLSNSGLIVSVDVRIAGVRTVSGLIENRELLVSGTVPESSSLHSTTAATAVVIECGSTIAQVRSRELPALTFPEGLCVIITLLGAGTENKECIILVGVYIWNM